MSVDLFNKRVNYSDGEGIFHGDANDGQAFLDAKLMEAIIQDGIGYTITGGLGVTNPTLGGNNGFDAPTTRAFCLSPGRAFLRVGTANNKAQIAPGTLMQKIGAADGAEAKLLAYTFAGTEEWTLVNGDATHPRLDLLQMKLEYETADSQSRDFEDATTGVVTTQSMNKKRRVKCTLSVKQGTAAASPTFPDPDTGCVPVGSILVLATETYGSPPSFSGGSSLSTIHDQRMPINVKCYRVQARQLYQTGYTENTLKDQLTSAGAGTNLLVAQCPVGKGRLLGVYWSKQGAISEGTLHLGGAPGDFASGVTESRRLLTSAAGSTGRAVNFLTFEGQHSPTSGPTLQQSATAKIGLPMWANGRPVAQQLNDLDGAGISSAILRIENTAINMVIRFVDFYVAEGI